MHPAPLKVLNIKTIDYTVMSKENKTEIEFIFLLTVKNWHHLEIMTKFDTEYELLSFELIRLYERVPYPWQLTNYIKIRLGALNASYFAVAYRDFQDDRQVMAIYELPRFRLNSTETEADDSEGIPVTRMLGAHRVKDSS